jgi:uncharacterized protein YggE
MKHHVLVAAGLLLVAHASLAQEKNFIDVPYIETSTRVDTLITPDRVYLKIALAEKDSKGKVTVEDLEARMLAKLEAIGIDVEKQLMVQDLASNFQQYFLRKQEVMKSKEYSLLLHDANTTMQVLVGLEEENIANVSVERTEYSRHEELLLELRRLAILKARRNAEAITAALGQGVGAPLHIADMTSSFSSPLMLETRVMGMRALDSNFAKSKQANLEFQKIRFEASVSAKFRMESPARP